MARNYSSGGPPTEPIGLGVVNSSSSSIDLAWNQPICGAKNVTKYEIKYKACNVSGAVWTSFKTITSEEHAHVTNLQCGTEYEFKIRALTADEDEGPFSNPNLKVYINQSLANRIKLKAQMSKKGIDGKPSILKLPLHQNQQSTNDGAKTRKCIFGSRKRDSPQEKTIMLVGATGSGKTTLIDGMINYITDVSWEDDFRLSLVDLTHEELENQTKKTQSQTEWITCYTIHKMNGSKIEYNLNIIDTPGFGDTRGIIRDRKLVDQIRTFFTSPGDQGIEFLDGICFVAPAPDGKLTPTQKYIFEAILSVFGYDVAPNIFVLITFCDASEPPVIEALKTANVPFQKSFRFNNSALFASRIRSSEETQFGKMFWKMGQNSFRLFFDNLKSVEAKSLRLTAEVLETRKGLETTIQGLLSQITEGTNKLNTIQQEQEVLEKHKTDIRENRDFTYEVVEIRMKEINLEPGEYVTNCLPCNRTCHFPCYIPNDEGKHGCYAMTDLYCRVCPKKCHWSVHRNNEFRIDSYQVKVKQTYYELKKKYEEAIKKETQQKSVIDDVKYAFESLKEKVNTMINDVRIYINKLNEIALRQNPMTELEYINLLIESEKTEHKYGWEKRVQLFDVFRKEVELVAKASEVNYKPFGASSDNFI